MSKKIRVLLYYKYVSIENGAQFAADHLEFCKSIGLLWFPIHFSIQTI